MKTTRFISIVILLASLFVGCNPDESIIKESHPARTGKHKTVCAKLTFDKDFYALSRAIAHEMAGDSSQSNHSGVTRAVDADGHKYYQIGDRTMLVYKTLDGKTHTTLSTPYDQAQLDSLGDDAAYFFWDVDDDCDETVDFTVVFPATRCDSVTGAIKYANMSKQDGTLAWVSDMDVATFTGSWDYMYTPEAIPLNNPLTVCKFTITNESGNDITNSVTDLRISDGYHEYVITRQAAPGPIFVLMQAVKKKNILFTSKIGDTHYVKYVKKKTLEAGDLYPITVEMEAPDLHNGPLPGIFAKISYKDGRPHGYRCFCFAPGNLRATTTNKGENWSWSFAPNQWDYLGRGDLNLKLRPSMTGYCGKNGTVDLFGWSSEKNYYGIAADEADFSLFRGNFRDWGDVFDSHMRWSTLSYEDWESVLFSDNKTPESYSIVNGVNEAHFAKGTVNGTHGLILFPEVYIQPAGVKAPEAINDRRSASSWNNNRYQGDDWTRMEVAGAVFLPAAGMRTDETSYQEGVGKYWTSSSDEKPDSRFSLQHSELLEFNETNLNPRDLGFRHYGCSVRLIKILSSSEAHELLK